MSEKQFTNHASYAQQPAAIKGWKSRVLATLGLLTAISVLCLSAAAQTITFEPATYSLGNINGQDGWKKTGSYDHAVSATSFPGFGTQSLRISNAITSGAFGDQTFSKPLVNEAGETGAANGGQSGGVRQNYFETQFTIGSAVPGAQQPGLFMSTSPDRGDGGRMSYLRFEDFADGIHVFFDEYKDNAPFGTTVQPNDPVGCGVEDDFTDDDIATLSRNVGHTIKFAIFFLDGPRNDVVQIYIDGVLVKTGTSWEDYFRFCEGNPTRTVDSLLFRTAGTAAPATSGNGFLIDNMGIASSTNAAPTMVVDDDGQASLTDCDVAGPAFTTVGSAVTASDPGDTIRICPGTYPLSSTVNLDKAGVTLVGIGTRPVIQAASGIGNAFVVSASGVTLDNLEIQKTDLANQNLVNVGGNNFTAKNSLIYGPDPDPGPGADWNTAGFVSRAFVISNNPGFLLQNNVIRYLRQPAYISGSFGVQAGVVSGNQVSATKGWVVEGGKVTFTGNTFGEPQNQASDIALLNQPTLNPADYTPLLALSTVNDNARIDPQYIAGGIGRAISYVNSSAASGGNGSDNAPYQTIADGVTGALNGGQVSVVGSFAENVTLTRSVNLTGSFTNTGSLTTTGGSSISPGNTPGIINSGNLSLSGGSTVNMELNGTTPGTGHDQLNVTGTVSLGGANLNVILGFPTSAGNQFVIVNNDLADAVTGTFNSLPQGSTVFAGGKSFSISYTGGTGNDVVLTTLAVCNTVSIPTNLTALTGQTVTAPVNISDTTGDGVFSTDFTVTYNPAVVTVNNVALGSVASGGTLNTGGSSGTLIVSVYSATPFSGAGPLVSITFNAIGAPGTSSAITFTNIVLNEEPLCTPASNGLITINAGNITGTVSYGNAIGSPAVRGIPNATLNAVGSVNTSANTDSAGFYTLSGLGSGPYTVTPSKSGGDNGALSGLDSARIAQHVVGLIVLNPTQLTVADVSGAGGVSSFDSALIARYTVALPNSGSSGTWIFTPVNRNYPNVNTNQPGQDYVALLMGDVTGNWNDPTSIIGSRATTTRGSKGIAITAGNANGSPGSEIVVPVTVGDVSGKGVVAYQFEISYDPAVLAPAENPVEIGGTMSDTMSVTVNSDTPGVLRAVVFGALPINGEGNLLNLKFTAIGEVGASSPLSWQQFMLNEGGALRTRITDGQITIRTANSEEASIRGNLFTAFGKGVPNTRVTLTDTTGVSRTVLSNESGSYQFGKVRMGETYTISAASRMYTFTPVTVSMSGDLANVDIIAEQ